jgi:hypothetical protein
MAVMRKGTKRGTRRLRKTTTTAKRAGSYLPAARANRLFKKYAKPAIRKGGRAIKREVSKYAKKKITRTKSDLLKLASKAKKNAKGRGKVLEKKLQTAALNKMKEMGSKMAKFLKSKGTQIALEAVMKEGGKLLM